MNAARRTHTDTPVLLGKTWLFPDGTRLPVIAGADDDAEVVVPEDLTTADPADLDALEAQLVAAFDAHLDEGSTDVASMTQIAEALDRVRGEKGARAAADEEAALTIAALRDRVHASNDEPDPDGDEPEPDADAEADAPAADDRVAVTAAAPPAPTRVRVPASASGTSRRSPRPSVDAAQARSYITAAADLPNIPTGAHIDVTQVAQAMHDRARGLSNGSPRVPIATIHTPYPADQFISKGMSSEAASDVLDRVANPQRLSLAASGGWCTPSVNNFELLSIDAATGLLDVPSVGIERGGMNIPSYVGIDAADGALWDWSEDQDEAVTITISDLDASAGTATVTTSANHLLQVGDVVNIVTGSAADGPATVATQNGTTGFTFATVGTPTVVSASGYATRQKSCFRIPCPTWTDYRLMAYGLCIEHGNLTDRAFPELTARYVSAVMAAHLRRISATHVATIASATHSTAVTVTDATSDSYGNMMSAVGLQVTDYRSQHYLSDNAVIEGIFPAWAKEVCRATLAMRAGVDLLAVTDAEINANFAVRNIRPQFVEDYQRLYSTTPKLAWPTTMDFLIYPAGSIVEGNGGKIDLGVVRDSRLNASNDFTAAWSEDMRLLARRGPLGRKATITLDTTGLTACCP